MLDNTEALCNTVKHADDLIELLPHLDDFTRIADCYGIRRQIFGDHASTTDYGPIPDRDAW